MAELIPLEYRIQVIRGRLVGRWLTVGVLAALVSGGSVVSTLMWKQRQTAAYDALAAERQAKSVLIAQAKELRERRLDLAARMQKMQELQNDKVLLSLLRNISDGFSASDCLEFINVEAHGARTAGERRESDEKAYAVRINGITANDTSHADLLNRLTEIGARSDPPITITPESLKRENLLDGQVMRFQILCERPKPKNS
jgi:hypothetical protein